MERILARLPIPRPMKVANPQELVGLWQVGQVARSSVKIGQVISSFIIVFPDPSGRGAVAQVYFLHLEGLYPDQGKDFGRASPGRTHEADVAAAAHLDGRRRVNAHFDVHQIRCRPNVVDLDGERVEELHLVIEGVRISIRQPQLIVMHDKLCVVKLPKGAVLLKADVPAPGGVDDDPNGVLPQHAEVLVQNQGHRTLVVRRELCILGPRPSALPFADDRRGHVDRFSSLQIGRKERDGRVVPVRVWIVLGRELVLERAQLLRVLGGALLPRLEQARPLPPNVGRLKEGKALRVRLQAVEAVSAVGSRRARLDRAVLLQALSSSRCALQRATLSGGCGIRSFRNVALVAWPLRSALFVEPRQLLEGPRKAGLAQLEQRRPGMVVLDMIGAPSAPSLGATVHAAEEGGEVVDGLLPLRRPAPRLVGAVRAAELAVFEQEPSAAPAGPAGPCHRPSGRLAQRSSGVRHGRLPRDVADDEGHGDVVRVRRVGVDELSNALERLAPDHAQILLVQEAEGRQHHVGAEVCEVVEVVSQPVAGAEGLEARARMVAIPFALVVPSEVPPEGSHLPVGVQLPEAEPSVGNVLPQEGPIIVDEQHGLGLDAESRTVAVEQAVGLEEDDASQALQPRRDGALLQRLRIAIPNEHHLADARPALHLLHLVHQRVEPFVLDAKVAHDHDAKVVGLAAPSRDVHCAALQAFPKLHRRAVVGSFRPRRRAKGRQIGLATEHGRDSGVQWRRSHGHRGDQQRPVVVRRLRTQRDPRFRRRRARIFSRWWADAACGGFWASLP
eukprot:scaffold189_cov249-Pinguiococcus_pyrenoidosus.AAC.21